MKIAHFAIITLIGRNSETVFRQPAGFPKRGMAEDATRGDATGVASSTEGMDTGVQIGTESEMAHLSNVDDFFFPSPPPLVDLACIQIGLDLWRQEINAHRTSGDALRKRDPHKNAPLSSILQKVPSRILSLIQPYAQKIGSQIGHWLYHHAEYHILGFEFLNRFCDFAIDFDGTIHHTRTAQRIVKSDSVSDDIKFKIACWYCLEDDVVRLWPSVMTRMRIENVNFHRHTQLYYWLHQLRGIASTDFEPSIVTSALDALYKNFHYSYWPAVKYFWTKLHLDSQRIYIVKLFHQSAACNRKEVFLRYVLAKLREDELRIFVDEHGDELLFSSPPPYIMRTWMYIKEWMTESCFCRLVGLVLIKSSKSMHSAPSNDHNMSEWCEVWATAPNHFKRSVISKMVRSTNRQENPLAFPPLARDPDRGRGNTKCLAMAERKRMLLRLAILSDASFHERGIFLHGNWPTVVRLTMADHLRKFVDLCFSGELQKHQFKKECMSSNPEVMRRFIYVLRNGDFNALEEQLAFWCPNQQNTETFMLRKPDGSELRFTTANDVRQYLLQNDFVVTGQLIGNADLLKQFIYTAFNDIQLASNFNDQLFATHREKIIKIFEYCIANGHFRDVMQFVDLFAPSEEIALRFKQDNIVPMLRSMLNNSYVEHLDKCLGKRFEEFESFIPWLLGSDDVILEFKNTLNIDELVLRVVLAKTSHSSGQKLYGVDFDWFYRCFQNLKPTDSALAKFLKWYFVTSESLLEFKQRFVMSVLSI